MAYGDLHAFLDALEVAEELHRVRVEVDPVLEIAEITDRMCKSPGGGKALLFERVKGSEHPVVTNVFGSCRRMARALEVEELSLLTRRMDGLFGCAGGSSLAEKLASLAGCTEYLRFQPKHVSHGVCQEVIESDPDLGRYPILKNWPGDGRPDHDGRFITLPLVFTRDPDDGTANCGMYRVEVLSGATAGVHWGRTSGGARHYTKYQARRERMPVAIALGGDPAVIYVASLPLPDPLDEMTFAGFLRQCPVEMVQCRTNELQVPANAEMVIEGYLEPGEVRREGAFGNHTGFYSVPEDVPAVHVTCITRRRGCVYPATVVGRPPMEDCHMAKATERLFLSFIRQDLPEVIDINLPLEGIFHGCAVIAIEKKGPGHARRVMETLWSRGWLAGSRLFVVVDGDLDVHDSSLSLWRVINNVAWRRDLVIAGEEVPPGAAFPFSGGKLGIDATRKVPGELLTGTWPEEITTPESVTELVNKRWREYGF